MAIWPSWKEGKHHWFRAEFLLERINLLPQIIDASVNHQVLRITYRNYKNCEEVRIAVVHPW